MDINHEQSEEDNGNNNKQQLVTLAACCNLIRLKMHIIYQNAKERTGGDTCDKT